MCMIVPTTFYVVRTRHWFVPLYAKSESETTRSSQEALVFISEQAARSFALGFNRKHRLEFIVARAGPGVCGPVLSLN